MWPWESRISRLSTLAFRAESPNRGNPTKRQRFEHAESPHCDSMDRARGRSFFELKPLRSPLANLRVEWACDNAPYSVRARDHRSPDSGGSGEGGGARYLSPHNSPHRITRTGSRFDREVASRRSASVSEDSQNHFRPPGGPAGEKELIRARKPLGGSSGRFDLHMNWLPRSRVPLPARPLPTTTRPHLDWV